MDTMYQLLALLICRHNESFRNSYDLRKILSRRFGFIHFVDLKKELQLSGLAEVISVDGIDQINITPKGNEFLENNLNRLKSEVLNSFPEQREFLQIFLDGYRQTD